MAHRAGNDLKQLRIAEKHGVALVEADVRRWRGRVEVRHLKTVGPLPIFWDRWRLASPLVRHLTLMELLAAVDAGTELMLDLKGRDLRLAHDVLAVLPTDRRVTVCSRTWRLLEPFAGLEHVRVVHSVGSTRQLRALLRRFPSLDGVSIHERLLDARTAAELRDRAAVVMSWPVSTLQRAGELAALGVDGLISNDLELGDETPA